MRGRDPGFPHFTRLAVEDNHMNRNNLTHFLAMVLLAAFLAITGCGGGSDGSDGATAQTA